VQSVTVIEGHHDGLFRSSGHRTNLLNNDFTEIGIGQEFGRFNNFDASMLTQNFASDRGDPFLLGVVFDDRDGDDFFDPGEELPGVRISVSGQGSVFTGPGGGYELRVADGQTITVTFAGGALDQSVTRKIVVGTQNVKLDLNTDESVTPPSPVDPLTPTPTPTPDVTDPIRIPELVGSASDDVMVGTGGADRIKTGAGDDLVRGAGGDDWLNGQSGDDLLRGGKGHDTLKGGVGSDHLKGHSGNDRLIGGRDDDKLIGGGGSDVLKGQAGNDRLVGGGGSDLLIGGGGADILVGGGGADRFHFSGNAGDDTVRRFQDGIDQISLRGSDDRFADLRITDTADGDALLTYAGGTVLFRGLDAGDLGSADFVFV
jgi:Ca2+-binding RTX toxin-like protein